jgi:Domain of unknown function (DUF6766)
MSSSFDASSSCARTGGGHLLCPHVVMALSTGQPAVTVMEYVGTPQFWFEWFQNWQSEFLALAAVVVISIF